MSQVNLDETSRRLHRAVTTGAYEEALLFLSEYARGVNATLAALNPESNEALAMVTQALDLLVWAHRVVRADRAHTAQELERLSALRTYQRSAHTTAVCNLEG